MDDIKNLVDIVEILKLQEQMQEILEKQQAEIEGLYLENSSLKEQLDESLQLNEQLTRQNKTLQKQINELSD